MRGSWLAIVRKTHTFLSLFFTPLLVLFIATGFWQTVASENEREKPDGLHVFLEKLSTVHTDGFYPRAGVANPSEILFKCLVVALSAALILSIVLGIILAWKNVKNKTTILIALGLGILVPAVILWIA